MAQKYRIYINDSTLIICSKSNMHHQEMQLIDSQNFDFLTFYNLIDKNITKTYLIVSREPKKLFNSIISSCNLIKAAGGLVKNNLGEFLFIFRNNKWDLPKGKVEEFEKLKQTAVREVEEECGVKIFKRKKLICKTYHIYEHHNKICLKQTNWYKMVVKTSTDLKPQIEEGILYAVWLPKYDLNKVLDNTYLSIKYVLKKGIKYKY